MDGRAREVGLPWGAFSDASYMRPARVRTISFPARGILRSPPKWEILRDSARPSITHEGRYQPLPRLSLAPPQRVTSRVSWKRKPRRAHWRELGLSRSGHVLHSCWSVGHDMTCERVETLGWNRKVSRGQRWHCRGCWRRTHRIRSRQAPKCGCGREVACGG